MPSATSSFEGKGWFNAALFRKNMTRFWPIWAVYAAVLFFTLPMEIILAAGRGYVRADLLDQVESHVYGAISNTVFVGVIFGLMAGMALFSYLMNNRSTGMLHALPIRREGLFLTNWLSGLAFFLVPDLAIALITLCAQAVAGAAMPGLVAWWFLAQTAVSMFFFCLAVFCAMFTGHILALPAFYGIVNILAYGIGTLMDTALATLLIGFNGGRFSSSVLVRWFTPPYQLVHLLEYTTSYTPYDDQMVSVATRGFDNGTPAAAIAYCVVVGAVLTALALEVYRRRQLERAGDLVTVGWVRPVFQYGLGVCGGMTLGTVLYMNFFDRLGTWAFIFLTAVCAVIFAFAGRMLLKKTLRVFADGWKGCAVLAVCLLVLLGGARMDLFGYQKWTPRADQVVTVNLRGAYSAPSDGGRYADYDITDPEAVAQVVAIHAGLVEHLDAMEREEAARWNADERYDSEGYQIKTVNTLRLSYLMADGRLVERLYNYVPITAEALTDPNSYASRLQALINRPEMVKSAYLGRWSLREAMDAGTAEAVGGYLNNTDDDGRYLENDLTAAQARTLWTAFQEDLEAGRIGRRYLLDDRDREANCYYTDITLSLAWPAVGQDGTRSTGSSDVTFTIQTTSTSTLKALEELGLRDRLLARGTEASGGVETVLAERASTR